MEQNEKPQFKKTNPEPLDRMIVIEQDSYDIPDHDLYHIKLPREFVFSPIDYQICVFIAMERNRHCIFSGKPDVGSANRDQEMDLQVIGVCGEYTLASLVDKAWQPGVNTFHSRPDVAGEEVRTRTEKDMEMFITDKDIKTYLEQGLNPRFWLVIGRPPRMIVAGWARLQDLHNVPEGEFKKKVTWIKDGRTHTRWYIHRKYLKTYIPVIAKHWMKPENQRQLPLNVKCEPPEEQAPRPPVEQIEPEF